MCMDMADPTIKITAPMDGATVMPSFDIQAEATVDCGLKKVHVDVVEDMIAAAKKAKKLLMCAQSTRFNGQAQTLKKVVVIPKRLVNFVVAG